MSQLEIEEMMVPHEQAAIAVRLRDGDLATIRPLRGGEADTLLTVFAGMSDTSRTLRYLTGMPSLPRQVLSVLTDVDDDRQVAWAAFVEGEPAGIARYVRLRDSTTAEIAFEVVDLHHGRGLATVLLDAVTTVAAARGIRRIEATMAPSNVASRRLLERIGLTGRLVSGLVEAEGALRLLDPPAVDRGAVLRLACAPDLALGVG